MALINKLVKISDYTGVYLKDDFEFRDLGIKEMKSNDLQKKIKPPYALVLRYYIGKSAKFETIHIPDASKTLKRHCDELEAQRKVKQLEGSFNKTVKRSTPTLREILEEYHSIKKTSGEHQKNQKYTLNSHLEKFADSPIDRIGSAGLQKIINSMLERGSSPRTAQSVKQLVRTLFNHAIKKGYTEKNPGQDMEIPKFDNKVYFSLNDDETEKLYEAITNYPLIMPRAIFIFLMNGRRRGETLQMKWEYINFKAKEYTTPAEINKPGKTITFPLTDDIEMALQMLGAKKEGWIFTHDGKNPAYKDVRHHWEKILKTAGIEKMRLHDLRHLIGYRASKAGVPLQVISRTLGHSNIQTTMRYSNADHSAIASALAVVKKGK